MGTFVNGIFIQILITINEYCLIECLGFCYIILQIIYYYINYILFDFRIVRQVYIICYIK